VGPARSHLHPPQLHRLRVPHTRDWYLRVAVFEALPRLFALLLLLFITQKGLVWRDDLYAYTTPIRFRWDIQNAINQGNRVLNLAASQAHIELSKTSIPSLPQVYHAWVDNYDQIYAESSDGRYSLDYTPLRLMVATLWVRHLTELHGPVSDFQDDYAQPMLSLNTASVLVAAVFGFLLARHWLRRGQRAQGLPAPPLSSSYASWGQAPRDAWHRHKPWLGGLLVFTLIFLNTACLIDGHVFPQWDVWVLPFFFIACYTASRNLWTLAGAALMTGALLKGQVLMVAPIFFLWPLAQRRWGAIARLTLGATSALALVVWPWLLREPGAYHQMIVAALAILAVATARYFILPRRRRAVVRLPVPSPRPDVASPASTDTPPPRPKPATSVIPTRPLDTPAPRSSSRFYRHAALVLILLILPFAFAYPAWLDPSSPLYHQGAYLAAGIALALVAALTLYRRPIRSLPYLLLGTLAFGTLLAGLRTSASWSWYAIGFAFPTEHFLEPAMGPTANLPAILAQRYQWGLKDPMFVLPTSLGGATLTLQTTFRILHFSLVTLVGLAAAHHARRKSPRILACFAAPWVTMFAFMPQMHERYLVWGAAAAALPAILSLGGLGLFLITTFFASACIAIQCLHQNHGWWPQAVRFIQPMIPDAGYAIALLALTYTYWCLIPSPKRKPLRQVRPMKPG
jgi:hypothetical protein